MRFLGGADLDGDEAFMFFGGKDAAGRGEGMKKSWKDAFEANANEYVEHDIYDCVNSMLMRIELLEKKIKTVCQNYSIKY